ncbi:cardioacceleratory peptide receptor-like isoform X2 [Saccostrea echinata]|uniref:cardioacceleratory peptide receptor-like isoform X2 n=1 Tax=Saccostrea echinata TaxID=191078 RepID=UPI002A837347|nr:cardioacceleratory peptide receptor-like isoform X2 [Saccostrea echinata]
MTNLTLLDEKGGLIQETFKCDSTRNFSAENITCIQENSHGRHEHYGEPQFWGEQRILVIVLLLSILIGNSIVLVAVAVSKRKSRMNFFIKQLAFADLLVGVFSVLPDLIQRFTVHWYAGEVMCKIVRFGMGTVTYGSTFVLVALSIDRLDAIARPLGFSDSWRRPRLMIAVSWILACLCSIPFAVLFKTDTCYINLTPKEWEIYLTVISCVVFFIPAIIIGICYSAMIYIIWLHTRGVPKSGGDKKVHESDKPLNAKSGFQIDKKPISYKDSKLMRGRETRMSSRGIIPQAKIRTIKMTFIIIFVFILCWSPYFVFNLLTVYHVIPVNKSTMALHSFIQSLAPLNSAANPIIYGVFSTRICRQLRNWAYSSIFSWIFKAIPNNKVCSHEIRMLHAR